MLWYTLWLIMTQLNTSYGWSSGDQVRILIAGGLPVSSYYLHQVTNDMNELGRMSIEAVSSVLDLVDQFESAQAQFNELNNLSNTKILTKADVLEWTVDEKQVYSPMVEVNRIRMLLKQYFGFSPLFSLQDSSLVRS
jgi:hypothetical protein